MQESDFRRLHWPILDFFRNRGISPEFSQDLVQETFLQAFKSRENFRGESKLDTWVGSIARNVWKQHWRTQSTQKRTAEEVPLEVLHEGDLKRAAADGADPPEDPLHNTLEREAGNLFRAALSQLSPLQRHCILLRHDQGRSYREIAVALQLTVNQVRSHLYQARARLERLLGERTDSEP